MFYVPIRFIFDTNTSVHLEYLFRCTEVNLLDGALNFLFALYL